MNERDRTPGRTREVSGTEVEAHEHARPEPGRGEFEADVEHIHRFLLREPLAPEEGRESVPWWLWAAAALAIFWGGWYLGRHGGTFGPSSHVAYPALQEYVAEQATEQAARTVTDPLETGRTVYNSRCQSCHQASGLGVPGNFPPLVGSEWVTGPPEIPVLILLNGLQGPIVVEGTTYDGVMPAWRDVLSDLEIAAVGSYIRQMEVNEAPPVEAKLVARLREATAQRQRPWTVEELVAAAEALRAQPASPASGGGR